jgi:hypothetical protein
MLAVLPGGVAFARGHTLVVVRAQPPAVLPAFVSVDLEPRHLVLTPLAFDSTRIDEQIMRGCDESGMNVGPKVDRRGTAIRCKNSRFTRRQQNSVSRRDAKQGRWFKCGNT